MNKPVMLCALLTALQLSCGSSSAPTTDSAEQARPTLGPGAAVVQQVQDAWRDRRPEDARALLSASSRKDADVYARLVSRLAASNLPPDATESYFSALAYPTRIVSEREENGRRYVALLYPDGMEGGVWLVKEGEGWRLDLSYDLAPTLKQLGYGDWRLSTLEAVKEGRLPKSALEGWGDPEWEEGEREGSGPGDRDDAIDER